MVMYFLCRFADDIELMTGKRPCLYWLICWKYLSPLAMLIILTSSFIKIIFEGSTYPRWVANEGIAIETEWPTWALFVALFLILVSVIWIPFVALGRYD